MEERARVFIYKLNLRRGISYSSLIAERFLESGQISNALKTITENQYGVTKEDIEERNILLAHFDDLVPLPKQVQYLINLK